MLRSRNLDNQTFDEIMDFVTGRLPWICPSWTDYNAHDPGITVLELIAWYKEMQQFHLNSVTDRMRRKMLSLVGAAPRRASPAHCYIDLPPGRPRAALSRLDNKEDIPFEVPEAAAGGAAVRAVYVMDGGVAQDVTDVLRQPQLSVRPFGNGDAEFWIGFDDITADDLLLYFEIDDTRPVARNPFNGPFLPRGIEWSFAGVGAAEPVSDETHALSQNGYVRFALPEVWPVYTDDSSMTPLRYLRLRLTDPGCEERVHVSSVSATRHKAVQRETWAHLTRYTAQADEARVTLTDEISLDGEIFAFVRGEGGLRQAQYTQEDASDSRVLTLDTAGAARDGGENLFLVSAAALHARDLFFASTGLPDMAIELPLRGRQLLEGSAVLICDTLCEDGEVRPAFWSYTDDLGVCAPGERVFTVDVDRERLVFGNGQHGAVIPRGENAILLAHAELSYCGGGNVPAGTLAFASDGLEVEHTAASGGTYAQSVRDAERAFLRRLESPQKCASQQDYERAALSTPGLRVAAAKALPGYDPDEPAGRSVIPIVTVVAAPYAGTERPMPDARFLEAVRAHLSRLRPICTTIKVIAPRYMPIGINVQVRAGDRGAVERMRNAAAEYFALGPRRGVGDSVVLGDLITLLTKTDGILKIERMELIRLAADCYTTPGGDISVPRSAITYLAKMDVDMR